MPEREQIQISMNVRIIRNKRAQNNYSFKYEVFYHSLNPKNHPSKSSDRLNLNPSEPGFGVHGG